MSERSADIAHQKPDARCAKAFQAAEEAPPSSVDPRGAEKRPLRLGPTAEGEESQLQAESGDGKAGLHIKCNRENGFRW